MPKNDPARAQERDAPPGAAGDPAAQRDEGELSDDELDKVSGGGNITPPPPPPPNGTG